MHIAITRPPSQAMTDCLLTFMDRERIDYDNALLQHQAYERTLKDLGMHVISLPPRDDTPDGVFLEDTAFVVDEVAFLSSMSNPSRARELDATAEALAPHREIIRLEPPARLEGGDIVRANKTIFVGLSTRTNQLGIDTLKETLEPLGYTIHAVHVTGCLHLSTAASHIGNGTILANPDWIDTTTMRDHEVIPVAPTEPWAGNTLLVGKTLIVPAISRRTRDTIETRNTPTITVDISEFAKAEAGLTCMSLRFAASPMPAAQRIVVKNAAPKAKI